MLNTMKVLNSVLNNMHASQNMLSINRLAEMFKLFTVLTNIYPSVHP